MDEFRTTTTIRKNGLLLVDSSFITSLSENEERKKREEKEQIVMKNGDDVKQPRLAAIGDDARHSFSKISKSERFCTKSGELRQISLTTPVFDGLFDAVRRVCSTALGIQQIYHHPICTNFITPTATV